jgi:hypothetical protein
VKIDHLFVFVEPPATEAAELEQAGLRESFRRRHPGQGTTNACFCFDNAYLGGFKFRNEHHLCTASRRGGCRGSDGS